MRALLAQTNSPWLISNLIEEKTGRPAVDAKEYEILNYKNLKVSESEYDVIIARLGSLGSQRRNGLKCSQI